MYKRVVAFSIIVVICLGLFLYFSKQAKAPTSSNNTSGTSTPSETISEQPSLSPSAMQAYCSPKDLQALVSLSGAAGNIFGTFTLKNISQKTCAILGGEFINVTYDKTIQNLYITHIGQTQAENFVLSPGQSLYSQVHYPNGPQCLSIGVNQTPVEFSYQISSSNSVIFSADTHINQIVQTCKSPTDMTQIEIWNMATEPITPGT